MKSKKVPNIVKMLGCPHDMVTSNSAVSVIGGHRRNFTAIEVIGYYEPNVYIYIIPHIHKYPKFQSVQEFNIRYQLIKKCLMTVNLRHGMHTSLFGKFDDGNYMSWAGTD